MLIGLGSGLLPLFIFVLLRRHGFNGVKTFGGGIFGNGSFGGGNLGDESLGVENLGVAGDLDVPA